MKKEIITTLYTEIWDGSPRVFETKELVRCRDCKHCSEERYFNNHAIITCMKTGDFHDPDWFCADGEAKNETS